MKEGNAARTARLGLLLAFALILGYVETLIPFPLGIPGMKLGLPNLAVLLTLYLYGSRQALAVNAARVLLSAFLFGNFFSLLYSLAGALFSFLVMALLKKNPAFSVTGISCAGGIAHNAAQLLVAVLVTETVRILYYIPPLLICGCLTGFCLGLVCRMVLSHLPDGFAARD
ncbi:MAG TPA: Gx transporter family protein [Candidatus Eisenbergiella merdipullorum]|uniref:Gx transporter family protein n=1 Tax=Candidatus Eisenbergiella merdipullorum TaxID=2838553 RepID=A0A9D2IA60_9FIRM|nr:Gx transporter family protein [Candidatus Eisenbergiella merdipullorum]